ncbi:MAG: hypothetical protein H6715_00115 [Myxococcales bacterium]|nr:hypothetical protein [Myxococcales bacterium]MCB9707368.1 hypothetical protein [Myxococcales bacterium]
MKFGSNLVFFSCAFVLALGPKAHAQVTIPDLREVRPGVMLLIDTSGSMERKGGCVCVTPGCIECYPTCGDSSVSERNRWANLTEILTGSWGDNFYCVAKDRRTAEFDSQYDSNYFIPHHALPLDLEQTDDGLVDVYIERVKFGMMTFDNIGTATDEAPLVPKSNFQTAGFLLKSAGPQGMYSYGEPKTLTFPGCATEYMVDLGARGPGMQPGALISVGLGAADFLIINTEVQEGIKHVRPFGGTPIAAMLDDARYYYGNHPDIVLDDYINCRDHYVVLVTDGYPDQDYRDDRFDCDGLDAFGNPTFSCPYQLPAEIAADLCDYNAVSGTCEGPVKGVFVVGFNVDAEATDTLNDIALAGGTEQALLAETPDELRAKLADALNAIASDATTRSSPAFVSPSDSGTQGQYQLQTGFQVGATGEPWTGVMERRRFTCNPATLEMEAQPISTAENDRFEEVLNNRSAPRNLYTVISGNNTSALTGTITNDTLESFDAANVNITSKRLGAGNNNTARRNEIIGWVHGDDGTARQGKRLGDIYHSSPVVVGPPRADIEDQSYNLFRQRAEVANRPVVAYVGTNDGILHAFSIEDYDDSGTPIEGGTELWGFIPPLLLPKLDSMVTARQLMLDSTPVAKDVFFSRMPSATPDASAYHSVLITGFRGGAKGFVALDVTDPLNPTFLWQFADSDMGFTYGRPAIGQAVVNFNGVVQERAIALLPGGTGSIDTLGSLSGPIGCKSNGKGSPPVNQGTTKARSHQRCWKQKEGRQLYVVDVATGTLLKHFTHAIWNAPVTGTPALFTEEVGTVATKAYVTDIDGVLWRIDLSSSNTGDWDAEPFHDIFWDSLPLAGQPAYDPPVLSVDNDGNTVILQASGNTDVLDGIVENRVVSLTEHVSYGVAEVTWEAEVNWEIRLEAGEVVTGPLDLFDGKVYFGTFQSPGLLTALLDACDIGQSRVWGVHYTEGALSALPLTQPTKLPNPAIEYPAGSDTWVRHFPELQNVIVMGVGVTKRPTCYDEDEETDPYLGTRTVVNASNGGGYQLVALAGGDAERATGQVIGSITRDLAPPAAITRVMSRVSSVE